MFASTAIGTTSAPTLLDPALQDLGQQRLSAGDYLGYLHLFGSHDRTVAFAYVAPGLAPAELVSTAREVWEMDDNPAANDRYWAKVLKVARDHPEHFMTADERETLASLPAELIVYRGVGPAEWRPRGFAWTLKQARAEFFAYHYRRGGRAPGHVLKATVKRRNVIAYLGERDEAEILLFPQAVPAWQIV